MSKNTILLIAVAVAAYFIWKKNKAQQRVIGTMQTERAMSELDQAAAASGAMY
jgi:hypothetical protein